MRLDKFTLRGQEAIQSGIEIAERNQNQQVEPEHVLFAMLEQSEGILRPVLGKLGANVQVVLNDLQAAVARFPRVQGGQQYFSPRLSQVFTAAQKQADQMKDEYVSTEHLQNALIHIDVDVLSADYMVSGMMRIPGQGEKDSGANVKTIPG